MARSLRQDIEYVDVLADDPHEPTSFYEKWVDQSSAKHAIPELIAADTLRRMYPGYSLIVSEDHRLASLFALPGIKIHSLDSQEAGTEQVSNVMFAPIPSYDVGEKVAGSLVDNTIVGSYRLTWVTIDFVVHITKFQHGHCNKTVYFILHDGPEQPARDLLLAVCLHAEQIHNEIWVFNRGCWSKSKTLWYEISVSSWNDVIMKEESKKALQKDIYGFFDSELTYVDLSIPWTRGLILHGPPGNGKTTSIKAIMQTCTERGFTPLYVKSFQSHQGEEVAMQTVFQKTRQLAPCVLILEDLDSLINDRNRSFFLNELDGLEGNHGLLVIASTNHFDRLDPGLSNRPSRFDRKYLFDDPDYQERVLYAKYWHKKLKDNEDAISFPVSLVEEVAKLTQGFSFAYLKEAFVSALVRITSNADLDEQVEFRVVLKSQIETLCKELEEQTPARFVPHPPITQPEKGSLDKRLSHIAQLVKDASLQISRGPVQPPSPMDVSSAETLDDSPSESLPEVRTVCKRPADPSGSRVTRKVSRTGSIRSSIPHARGVLHAPPSAYPQVMPGSLPSTRQELLPQDLDYPAWRAGPVPSNASTIPDVHAEVSMD